MEACRFENSDSKYTLFLRKEEMPLNPSKIVTFPGPRI